MSRFEVVFYPEEFGERMAELCVVEWTNTTSSAKFGRTLKKFAPSEQREAEEFASVCQHEYNLQFASEFA